MEKINKIIKNKKNINTYLDVDTIKNICGEYYLGHIVQNDRCVVYVTSSSAAMMFRVKFPRLMIHNKKVMFQQGTETK